MRNPFRYFKTSPDVIRLAVVMYVRYPFSLRQVEDLLHERRIDISNETVRAWWDRLSITVPAALKQCGGASRLIITDDDMESERKALSE